MHFYAVSSALVIKNIIFFCMQNLMEVKKIYEFDPKKDLLGEGGFGSVYKALDVNLQIPVAIKKYTAKLPTKYSLFEEIKRVIALSHPNLVRYYDAFELHETSTFGDKIQVGVLEYINGGDLVHFMATQPTKETISQIIIGVMDGLRYLHHNHIIHRDIKPENILIQITENNEIIPKIADFGISKALKEGSAGSSLVIGSIEYMAPEQFNPAKYGINGALHTNLDIWALGCIITELLTGSAPFGKTASGTPRDEIMRNILDADIQTIIQKIPAPYQQVVQQCLVRNANQRAQNIDQLWNTLNQNQPQLQHQILQTTTTQTFNTATINFGSSNTSLPYPNQQYTSTVLTAAPQANTATIVWSILPFIISLSVFAYAHLRMQLGFTFDSQNYHNYLKIVAATALIPTLILTLLNPYKKQNITAYLATLLGLTFYALKSHFILPLLPRSQFYALHPFAKFFPPTAIALIICSAIYTFLKHKNSPTFSLIISILAIIILILTLFF